MKLPEDITSRPIIRCIGALIWVIALVTCLCTMEHGTPFWDCPEYVAIGATMQPGHPPGNPLWMLCARFFMNFAPGPSSYALACSVMSAVCGAFTVLLVYLCGIWLTHRLKWGGKGLAGSVTASLVLCWSDSFWYSTIEPEVYSLSLLCTALVFYLSLLWLGRCDSPHADRYLVAIGYLTGLSLGAHELNLLCLPAVALTVSYGLRPRRWPGRIPVVISLGCLAVGFLLYIFIPGILRCACGLELWCVNTLHLPIHTGLLLTVIIIPVLFGTAIWLVSRSRRKGIFIRTLRFSLWGLLMFYIGFCCYGIILIRGGSGATVNTGAPGNIMAFRAYFERDQYGHPPLLKGAPFSAMPMRRVTADPGGHLLYTHNALRYTTPLYTVAEPGLSYPSPRSMPPGVTPPVDSGVNRPRYILTGYASEYLYPPELEMWLPRMHARGAAIAQGYMNWGGGSGDDWYSPSHLTLAIDSAGNPVDMPLGIPGVEYTQERPSYRQNFQYMAAYQIGYMYMRYLLWNFMGRQNEYTGHGEPDAGNFITGFDPLDTLLLDVCADAPLDAGASNPAHNRLFGIPLLLGLIGIVYLCRNSRNSRRASAVITALFVMTGVAIVLVLNQHTLQARERDYAFLGSFMAYAMWTGAGASAVVAACSRLPHHKRLGQTIGCMLVVAVPLWMLVQNYDDHNRRGRMGTTHMALNILNSLPPDAIIFAPADNDIFPLGYAQEVLGLRTDVRVVAEPYLTTPWYQLALRTPMHRSAPLPFTLSRQLAAVSALGSVRISTADTAPLPAIEMLRNLYAQAPPYRISTPRVFIPLGKDTIRLDLAHDAMGNRVNLLPPADLATLDLLATNAASPTPRPIFFCNAHSSGILQGRLTPYLTDNGLYHRLDASAQTDDPHILASQICNQWLWGEEPGGANATFDPLSRSELGKLRTTALTCASRLIESQDPQTALQVLECCESKMPPGVPYQAVKLGYEWQPDSLRPVMHQGLFTAGLYTSLGRNLNRPDLCKKGARLQQVQSDRLQALKEYVQALRPSYRQFISFRLQYFLDSARQPRQSSRWEP